MREYKFKAYYKPLKRMLEPEQIESINFDTKVLGVYMEMDGKGYHKLRMYDFILLQFTGLKDNTNDEEWYEGDILTPNPHSNRTELDVICYDSHQGKYKSVPLGLYRSNAGDGGWTGFDIKCYQKRVGSIHDNPELLEVGL